MITSWIYRASFFLFYVACTIVSFAIFRHDAAGADSPTASLAVSVRLNKVEWTKGDRIEITIVRKNVSSEALRLPPMFSPFPIAYIELFGIGEMPLRSYTYVHVQISPPVRDNFMELKPGQEATRTFEATLREDAVPDFQTQDYPIVRGLFLDFGHSSIFVPGKGKYRLRFQIHHSKEWSQTQENQFDLDNIWHGKLVSDPVDIVVR